MGCGRGTMRNAFIAVVLGGLAAGCALPGQAGMDLPRQNDAETYSGDRSQLAGVLATASNGCLTIGMNSGDYLVIWPRGSEFANRGELPAGVRLPDGQVISPGDAMSGTGAFTPTAPLVANRHGYWAHTIGYCAPSASQVVVFDSVALVH